MDGRTKALLIIVLLILLTMGGVKVKKEVTKFVTAKGKEDRIKQLLPEVQKALRDTIAALAAQGIQVHVGQTLRDGELQASLVAGGKSATQKSWHLLGRAIDIYPVVNGQPDLQGKNLELFRTMQKVASAHGFKNLAFNADGTKRYITTNKGKTWDGGHIEYRGSYLTFDAALAGARKTGVA